MRRRLPYYIRIATDVDCDVVARRLEPTHVVGSHEQDAATGLDRQPTQKAATRSHTLVKPLERGRFMAFGRKIAPNAADRLSKPLIVERLQQVVGRVSFESSDGVLIVSRHENHHRPLNAV